MIIIFDFDGTIADTTKHFLTMANELAREFKFTEITPEQFERARGVPPKAMLKELKIPIRALPKLRKASHASFQARMNQIELIDGMREVIEELSTKHTIGILTSNDADLVHSVLRRLELDGQFTFINSAVNVFGKHRALNKIIKRNSYNKADTIYIGDEVRDIEGAQKAGIKCAAVNWGFNSEGILREYKPDFFVNKPSDIIQIARQH